MKHKIVILAAAAMLMSSCTLSGKEKVVEKRTVVQRPSMTVLGIECRTSNAPDAGVKDIPLHWERFLSQDVMSQIPNRASDEVIALYCDYEGDHTQSYSLVIGCPVSLVDVIPEGMVAKTLPAGAYAVFRAVGEHPQAVVETWGNIWQQTDLKRTYTGDYEVYGDKFVSGSPKEVEVVIAIE
jgi:predicted transcriptional regulator YdeE